MTDACTMCDSEAASCAEARVGGEAVVLCPSCRQLLERNDRLEAATVPGGDD